MGVALHLATIGVSMHPDPEVRVCDTLDWYAPRYMSRHTFDEVAGWFRDAGLTDVVDLDPRSRVLPRRAGKRHQHRRPQAATGFRRVQSVTACRIEYPCRHQTRDRAARGGGPAGRAT